MADLNELITQTLSEMEEEDDERIYCTIDDLTRKITVPSSISIFAVAGDANTNRIWFKAPKVVGDGFDLTKCTIRINYITPAGDTDTFYTQFFEQQDDEVIFSWLIARQAVRTKGTLSFIVCAIRADENGVITDEWNSAIATATVLEGVEPSGQETDEEVTDAVAQAKASSTSAEAYALRAETAANLAIASEENADGSEDNAKTSETNAAVSETNASTSELNALKSEQNAAASEANAASSAAAAKTSEAKSSASEINARESETNAKASENKSSQSEANAKASEEAARSSEQAAKISEGNAASSEESASNSASSAAAALADLLKMMGTDIATLAGGKIPASQIPAIATTEIYTVSTDAERDALTDVQDGDVCVVTPTDASLAKSYIYKSDGWVYLASPTDYAATAGHAETATIAENSNTINGHRLVQMSEENFATAVLDPDTYYLVFTEEET